DETEKREKFARYACHELSFFIHQKDPAFFKTVITPYLKNKKDKTFMDHWLLNHDLSAWLEPWNFNRLNDVERALLGRRLAGERARLNRHIRERADLIVPDIDDFIRRFDTASAFSALQIGGDLLGTVIAGIVMTDSEVPVNLGWVDSRPAPGEERAKGLTDERRKELSSLLRMQSKDRVALEREAERLMEKNNVDFIADDGLEVALAVDKNFNGRMDLFGAAPKARHRQRQLFRKLDATEEWVENNYYRLPIEQQLAGLIPASRFWADFAEHDGQTPFLSPHLAEATRNFSEMMLALAVLDLPFEAGEHASETKGLSYTFTAANPLVVFHKEIRESETSDDPSPILVSQYFFRADDRYRHENNQRFEKYVTEEFLQQIVYGCQVILTNPNPNRRKLSLLLQIPEGAIPVNRGFHTKGRQVSLEPYATTTMEYYFYFPEAGTYPHYPVQVARNEKLIAGAEPFVFKVVEKLSRLDKTSWAWISQHGTEKQTLDFLEANNLNRLNLGLAAWRLTKKSFYRQALELLNRRHHYDGTFWSYALHHHDRANLSEFLRHSSYANQVGPFIDTPLLKVEPIERHLYQHMEYAPLVNARAHQVGRERTILNHRLRSQVQRLMNLLSYRETLSDEDELAVAYYMFLQGRIAEGLDWFGRVNLKHIAARLQVDYMKAWASLYEGQIDQARALAESHAEHPVPRWRSRFVNVLNQIREVDGAAAEAIDPEDREQVQGRLAATAPRFTLSENEGVIRLDYANLDQCRVNLYPMDIELLFSRQPFLQDQSAQFALIRPVKSSVIELEKDEGSLPVPIAEPFQDRNVMVEVTSGGLREARARYANRLVVEMIENYGQLKVRHRESGKPLSRVYVKVYGRSRNGEVKFFKDCYTDFRGRFDYVSLNTNEIDNTAKLAVLILSHEHGAVVREANPPKR
ncbi:MAG: hypothetical protein AAF492_06010, partial [Verrucomicrobiota bacterium]